MNSKFAFPITYALTHKTTYKRNENRNFDMTHNAKLTEFNYHPTLMGANEAFASKLPYLNTCETKIDMASHALTTEFNAHSPHNMAQMRHSQGTKTFPHPKITYHKTT